jgi:hypothetical protein
MMWQLKSCLKCQGDLYLRTRSFSRVRQQKYLAHLQKTLSILLEKKRGRAREFGENLKMLLRMAMDLWEEYQAGEAEDFEGRVAELRFVISYQLRERTLRDRDNRHLLAASSDCP